jgi:hypothetical protein
LCFYAATKTVFIAASRASEAADYLRSFFGSAGKSGPL